MGQSQVTLRHQKFTVPRARGRANGRASGPVLTSEFLAVLSHCADAQRFADQMSIRMFETSAKENKNVEDMFNCITRQVLDSKKRRQEREAEAAKNDTVQLGRGRGKNSVATRLKNKKCCS